MNPAMSNLRPLFRQARPDLLMTQKRHSIYNKYRHGPQKISNPDPPYAGWVKEFFSKDGQKSFWKDVKSTLGEFVKWDRNPTPIQNRVYKIECFDTDESIKRWKPVSDRDSLNGFSESRLIRSPAGHALFTGIIDNQTPDDGMTENSGFAAIIGPTAPRHSLWQTETHWNWTKYNCLEIKFRGDGRKYQLVLNTGTYKSDLEYYDGHSYFIHTRGGPYWQTLRIPFHKFVFTYKNFIQDRQKWGLPAQRVKFVAINIQDKIDGPFSLEIDHIGLVKETRPHDALSAYELYTFEHLKYRPVGIDCPVPER